VREAYLFSVTAFIHDDTGSDDKCMHAAAHASDSHFHQQKQLEIMFPQAWCKNPM